jgi:hypothetical protein
MSGYVWMCPPHCCLSGWVMRYLFSPHQVIHGGVHILHWQSLLHGQVRTRELENDDIETGRKCDQFPSIKIKINSNTRRRKKWGVCALKRAGSVTHFVRLSTDYRKQSRSLHETLCRDLQGSLSSFLGGIDWFDCWAFGLDYRSDRELKSSIKWFDYQVIWNYHLIISDSAMWKRLQNVYSQFKQTRLKPLS